MRNVFGVPYFDEVIKGPRYPNKQTTFYITQQGNYTDGHIVFPLYVLNDKQRLGLRMGEKNLNENWITSRDKNRFLAKHRVQFIAGIATHIRRDWRMYIMMTGRGEEIIVNAAYIHLFADVLLLSEFYKTNIDNYITVLFEYKTIGYIAPVREGTDIRKMYFTNKVGI